MRRTKETQTRPSRDMKSDSRPGTGNGGKKKPPKKTKVGLPTKGGISLFFTMVFTSSTIGSGGTFSESLGSFHEYNRIPRLAMVVSTKY